MAALFFIILFQEGTNFMIKSKWSAIITAILCLMIFVALIVMIAVMPSIADWYYNTLRKGAAGDGKPLLYAFYCCVPAAFLAIYHIIRLMLNIQKGQVFELRNVTHLRFLSWCCAYVAVVTFVAGIFYLPLFIISFAAVFVCLCIRVLRLVLAEAVEIKNENELTI